MIRFYRDQYDHYTVYDNRKEIGFIHCINYYSAKNRNFRLWTYHVDFGKGESYDDSGTGILSKVKKEFIAFYIDCIPKHLEWIKVLSE